MQRESVAAVTVDEGEVLKLCQAEAMIGETDELLKLASEILAGLSLDGLSAGQAAEFARAHLLVSVTRDRVSQGRLALGWA